jgi:phosphonate metabolism-associated iron-containing alcohol dehydrogenase
MWSYNNPVKIRFGRGGLLKLPECLRQRPYALITYSDEHFRPLRGRVEALAGPPELVIDNVQPNPSFAAVADACEHWARARKSTEVIVAVGGGSVIDTAKAVAAADGDFARLRQCLATGRPTGSPGAVPIIAVPTTAGTGSEVTMWATLWDTEHGRKYSLSDSDLYAETAIVDPELTLAMPRSLTISTGLDALSHAVESLWNRNSNPVSVEFAVAAAREVLTVLPAVAVDPGNLELRTRMAQAALFAGLAFSNTKTALAHSISYPITLGYGVPHGIACSFCLPFVMRSAIGQAAMCDAALQRIFGPDLHAGADRLEGFLTDLGISVNPADHGVEAGRWSEMVSDALTGERGKNFIAPPDHVIGIMGVRLQP